jgi:hypothetical protein
MKSLGQFAHPLPPRLWQWAPCFEGAQISLYRGECPAATEARESRGRAWCPVRGLRWGRGGRLCALRTVRVALSAPAPGGGDSVPLISALLTSDCRSREGECAAGARKLLHLESFTLSRAGEGREETRPPRGQWRGRQEGRGLVSPSGWCQVPTLALHGPAAGADGQRVRQTDRHVLGRRAPRSGGLDAPGPRALMPGWVTADQRTGGRGRRERGPLQGGRGAGLGPATGDPESLRQRRPRALCDQMRSGEEGTSQMPGDSWLAARRREARSARVVPTPRTLPPGPGHSNIKLQPPPHPAPQPLPALLPPLFP